MSATCQSDCNVERHLYVAFELSQASWKLGFRTGRGQKTRRRDIAARDRFAVEQEIRAAKDRYGLPSEVPVVSCYEAGRDGFWLHRYLVNQGVENLVVDSSSIQVNRRKRRAKTDRLDVEKLIRMLIRWHEGEEDVWSVVNVPTIRDENDRQLHRELTSLKSEQTRHINRIKGLLISYGIALPKVSRHFPQQLKALQLWNRSPIPEELQSRLLREFERMRVANHQIRELEQLRARRVREDEADSRIIQVRRLLRLKGIGLNSAWPFVMEIFGWRTIKNRRQLASLMGMTPTPFNSGQGERDQGISKAGNSRLRSINVELAWGWLMFQRQSELSQWYQRRFANGGKRQRRIGIVALGRKLIVDLWKYLETGIPPAGAVMTDWRTKIEYTPNLS